MDKKIEVEVMESNVVGKEKLLILCSEKDNLYTMFKEGEIKLVINDED